ncbi:CLUMA_CG004501, isoform A [Clunio marinus]|uniref:Regulatory protein zeste n=1 Tax=Clunio marinus TaxID=568069 RepID=A0A1J1HS53_9DIPT|nr:CLUMA_CG004501, isoform A [Clunio marinus]
MNDREYNKRKRSENFDQVEIDLLLNIVKENKHLIDSPKQENKKKGWGIVYKNFNESCPGTKRDIETLRMKLKNLRAVKKRMNLSDSKEDNQDTSQDSICGDEISDEPSSKRKRSKTFTDEEVELLQSLLQKHFLSLETSLTRESLGLRQNAWKIITEEFNKADLNGHRDMYELKIKYKNLKALRFKKENDATDSAVTYEEVHLESSQDETIVPETKNERSKVKFVKTVEKTPKQQARVVTVEDYSDIIDDYDILDEFQTPQQNTSITSEVDRVRKENVFLKNAVLKKKERLLELQIALAERNLRRHQV